MVFGVDVGTFLVAVIGFLLAYLFWNRDRGRYPPGPRTLPIVGNLHELVRNPVIHVQIEKWRKDHGDFFTYWLGSMPVVVLASFPLIREAYVDMNDKFLDRPQLYVVKRIFKGFGLFFLNYGKQWKELRKMALETMRDLGVGKTSLEEKILDEVAAIFKEIEQLEDTPFNIRQMVQQAMVNVICAVNFGRRFEYDDKRMKKLLHLLNDFFTGPNPARSPLNSFPWLRFFDRTLERPIRNLEQTRELVIEQVAEHRATFDPDNIRDFIDVFLKTEQEQKHTNNNTFLDNNLFQMIHDLFNAGSETAASSLSWALLFLIRNPDVQARMQAEIDQVVGSSRAPSIKDKPDLPYTNAVINETLRVGNVAPMVPPHATLEDVNFHGHFLPKGTFVMASIWAVHHDPKYWTDPYKYNPNRWLDENGKMIRHEAFMPFSMGMRRCVGEQLAKMELYIILTSLVQRYTFSVPAGHPRPSEDTDKSGIVRRPPDYLMTAKRRL